MLSPTSDRNSSPIFSHSQQDVANIIEADFNLSYSLYKEQNIWMSDKLGFLAEVFSSRESHD